MFTFKDSNASMQINPEETYYEPASHKNQGTVSLKFQDGNWLLNWYTCAEKSAPKL